MYTYCSYMLHMECLIWIVWHVVALSSLDLLVAASTILSGTLLMPARRVSGTLVQHRFSLISSLPCGRRIKFSLLAWPANLGYVWNVKWSFISYLTPHADPLPWPAAKTVYKQLATLSSTQNFWKMSEWYSMVSMPQSDFFFLQPLTQLSS